jgi:hypothetical protein
VLFDAAYASAVVRHFNALRQGFLDGWDTKFYLGGPTTTALANDQRRLEQAAVEKDNPKRQVEERSERHELRDTQGSSGRRMAIFDLLLKYKYIGMKPEVAVRYEENLQGENAMRDREELEAKVSSWRQEIPQVRARCPGSLPMFIAVLRRPLKRCDPNRAAGGRLRGRS